MADSRIEEVIRNAQLREPFSARCIERFEPKLSRGAISNFLRTQSAKKERCQQPLFVRVFRGWYRFNRDPAD